MSGERGMDALVAHESQKVAVSEAYWKGREDAQRAFASGLLSLPVVCPIHGIPDCGPLLNGCQVPRYIAEWRGEVVAALSERTS